MTTKQIAESLGKPYETVRDWVKSIASKSATIKAKSALSSPMKPADYDLSETCLIIEEGLGKPAADVFRTNAVNAKLVGSETKEKSLVRLPTGVQMNALIKMTEKGLITREQFQIMVGAPIIITQKVQISAPPVNLTPAGYAVEMKTRAAIEAKQLSDAKNGKLF